VDSNTPLGGSNGMADGVEPFLVEACGLRGRLLRLGPLVETVLSRHAYPEAVAVYRPEFFGDCEPGRFPLAPMLKEAANAGTLAGSLYEGLWADIGTPERLTALENSAKNA